MKADPVGQASSASILVSNAGPGAVSGGKKKKTKHFQRE